jgi:cbb3-type cytochrome oxidase subunit 3
VWKDTISKQLKASFIHSLITLGLFIFFVVVVVVLAQNRKEINEHG